MEQRPITFPDTVLVAHRVKADTLDRRRFELEGAVYSYSCAPRFLSTRVRAGALTDTVVRVGKRP